MKRMHAQIWECCLKRMSIRIVVFFWNRVYFYVYGAMRRMKGHKCHKQQQPTQRYCRNAINCSSITGSLSKAKTL